MAEVVAVGVGRKYWGCADCAGVVGSVPGTVWGVCGWDTWARRCCTVFTALSRSWETSAWSLSDSEGSVDIPSSLLMVSPLLEASSAKRTLL